MSAISEEIAMKYIKKLEEEIAGLQMMQKTSTTITTFLGYTEFELQKMIEFYFEHHTKAKE